MKIAIVGGGIMGISLGYYLTSAGAEVDIYEASPTLGGLAGPLYLPDGTPVDRFYHAILSSDRNLAGLSQALGVADQLRFRETRMGFYFGGRVHPMNNLVDFFRFPPLNWIDRFRLGLTVLYAQWVRDWHSLERISVEQWLVGLSGRRTFENLWRPMLQAKFDGGFADTPATYIWSRLVRMKSTRGGASQKEMAGHLVGGYATLLQAMAERITAAGSRIHLRTPIQEIVVGQRGARGLRVGGEVRAFDAIAATVQVPLFRRLMANADPVYVNELGQTSYLGIVCPLLVLDRPLSGYWTINITDSWVPFTGIIETTAYIDPQYVGGHHLVYLPKYTLPGSAWQTKSDEEIREVWLHNLQTMFPDFDRRSVRYCLVHRERYVEPLHGLNARHQIPAVQTPVPGLYLATTAQIYPALTNGESVTRHAQAAADLILATTATTTEPAARRVPVITYAS